MASPGIMCESSGRLTATAALTVPVWGISGSTAGYLNASAPEMASKPRMYAAGAGTLTLSGAANLVNTVYMGGVAAVITLGAGGRMSNGSLGLTVWDAALDVYGLFKIEVKSPTQLDLARSRILAAINNVMQQIWSRADKLNYFNQETISVTVLEGTQEIELPENVQSVVGPITTSDGKTLSPIGTREALNNYVDYWFGGTAPDIQPPAYWLNCSQDLSQGDRTSIKVKLPWVTTADYDLEMQVVHGVARFKESDLLNASPIRLPAKYVELLFLPLLREWASTDHLFNNEAARPGIAAAAAYAKQALGMIEPGQGIVKKLNGEDVTP